MPTPKQSWGVCPNCDSWGPAPQKFDPRTEVLVCNWCNSAMYLSPDPREAGYRESKKVTVRAEPLTNWPGL
jgi:hypothetical protein